MDLNAVTPVPIHLTRLYGTSFPLFMTETITSTKKTTPSACELDVSREQKKKKQNPVNGKVKWLNGNAILVK